MIKKSHTVLELNTRFITKLHSAVVSVVYNCTRGTMYNVCMCMCVGVCVCDVLSLQVCDLVVVCVHIVIEVLVIQWYIWIFVSSDTSDDALLDLGPFAANIGWLVVVARTNG